MAICGACGGESSRISISYDKHGNVTKESCSLCTEVPLEKITNPSDKRIWVGPEYMPNMYRKLDDGSYEAKDELRADTEAQVMKESEDDKLAYESAVEKKRHERRTRPMSQQELEAAKSKVERLFSLEGHVQ